jgi:Hydrogenase maturation factor
MKCVDAFRSREITAPLVEEIARVLTRPVRIMEVCGTHTMSIFRHGNPLAAARGDHPAFRPGVPGLRHPGRAISMPSSPPPACPR